MAIKNKDTVKFTINIINDYIGYKLEINYKDE